MSTDSQSNDLEADFGEYRRHGGSPSREEYESVRRALQTQGEMRAAIRAITGAGVGFPDAEFANTTAKIMHALGPQDERVRSVMGWLIPETYLLLRRY